MAHTIGRKRGGRPDNKTSLLLDAQENEAVVNIVVASNSVTLATGVVQVLLAEPPMRIQWMKRFTGVVCLCKDFGKRSYCVFTSFRNRSNILIREFSN